MKKISLQIIISLCLFSCSILEFNQETIIFVNIDEKLELNNKLFLHKDGTFLYEVQISSLKANSEGYWERKGNEIELKSLDKYKRGIMKVNESIIDMKSVQVKIVDSENIPLETAIVNLNNNTNANAIGVTNEEGITLFENQKIKSININFLGQNYVYQTNKSATNFFEIKLKLKDISVIYFKKEKWILKGKNIITSDDLTLKRVLSD